MEPSFVPGDSSGATGLARLLPDLLESKEVPGVPLNDVQEVSSYVAALQFGLKKLRQERPFLSIPAASKQLHLSQPAVTKAMKALQQLGIVDESSGRAWKRVFVYSTYLNIMTEGTERLAQDRGSNAID